jgi:hypothetical protein
MPQHDAELEAFRQLKEKQEKKAHPQKGVKKKISPEQKAAEVAKQKATKAAKRALLESRRGALNATNMYYHDEEKNIQQYYRSKFTDKVIAEKGELSITDELIIDTLSYCAVRLMRKAKLESMFGRFMDRTAPQDPVAQLLSCVKALGLKNNLKGTESSKDVISKLLGQDAAELSNTSTTLSLDEWREAEMAKGGMRIERRAMTDFADNDEYYKTPEQLEKEEAEKIEQNNISNEMPTFEM